jgi:hypothetical protein
MTIGVYNPVGEIAEIESVQTTTLVDLHGKSVGFVCNHHPASTELWSQLEQSIERDFAPRVVRRVSKPNISVPQPQAQLAKLASEVDYAIVGVGA